MMFHFYDLMNESFLFKKKKKIGALSRTQYFNNKIEVANYYLFLSRSTINITLFLTLKKFHLNFVVKMLCL